jgi:hypothetical protein
MKISEVMSSGINPKDFWDVVSTLDRSQTPDALYPVSGYRVKASYEEAMVNGVYDPYIDRIIKTAFQHFDTLLSKIKNRSQQFTSKRILIQRHTGIVTDKDSWYMMIDGEETKLD